MSKIILLVFLILLVLLVLVRSHFGSSHFGSSISCCGGGGDGRDPLLCREAAAAKLPRQWYERACGNVQTAAATAWQRHCRCPRGHTLSAVGLSTLWCPLPGQDKTYGGWGLCASSNGIRSIQHLPCRRAGASHAPSAAAAPAGAPRPSQAPHLMHRPVAPTTTDAVPAYVTPGTQHEEDRHKALRELDEEQQLVVKRLRRKYMYMCEDAIVILQICCVVCDVA